MTLSLVLFAFKFKKVINVCELDDVYEGLMSYSENEKLRLAQLR